MSNKLKIVCAIIIPVLIFGLFGMGILDSFAFGMKDLFGVGDVGMLLLVVVIALLPSIIFLAKTTFSKKKIFIFLGVIVSILIIFVIIFGIALSYSLKGI